MLRKGKFTVKSQAKLDSFEIARYIGQRNPEMGHQFLDELYSTFESIAAMLEIGVSWPTNNKALKGIRKFPVRNFSNFIIFYRIAGSSRVEILRVLHAARDLPNLFD